MECEVNTLTIKENNNEQKRSYLFIARQSCKYMRLKLTPPEKSWIRPRASYLLHVVHVLFSVD